MATFETAIFDSLIFINIRHHGNDLRKGRTTNFQLVSIALIEQQSDLWQDIYSNKCNFFLCLSGDVFFSFASLYPSWWHSLPTATGNVNVCVYTKINNHLSFATTVEKNSALEISFNLVERKYWILLEFVRRLFAEDATVKYIFYCTACR